MGKEPIETPEQTFERVYEIAQSEVPNFKDYNVIQRVCELYHIERQSINQQQPVKGLQGLIKEVATKYGYNFEVLYYQHLVNSREMEHLYKEAAELYASQFKPKVITDEEIDKESFSHMKLNACSCPDDQTEGMIANSFEMGAKWMRDKLK